MGRTFSILVLLAFLAVSCAGCSCGPSAPDPQAAPATPDPFPEQRAPCTQHNPLRNAYFGDLHIHTALSFDAWIWEGRQTPGDAYRFAKGESIPLSPVSAHQPDTARIQLERPLDFAAVTDHAEFLAEVEACVQPGSEAYDTLSCVLFRQGSFLSTVIIANQLYLNDPRRSADICGPAGADCPALAKSVWKRVQDAAEEAYDRTSDCSFTSFVGYEYTGVPKISNMHRNVIFRNHVVPELPVSYFEQPTKHGLWSELKRTCIDGMPDCDVLAIPHNSNLSNGNQFIPEYPGADSLQGQRDQASLRVQVEPLVEIFQHKGDAECMNGLYGVLGQPDELCAFEKMRKPDFPDCMDGTGSMAEIGLGCISRLDFVRFVLLEGLKEEARIGVNPYRLGIIASTDTHNATGGAVVEDRYAGHHQNQDDSPSERLGPEKIVMNPGGLAAVWAEENSRNAIFDALKRRETFGTSGPRIVVRLFGLEYPDTLCQDPDFVETGYRRGVPMGGSLPPRPLHAAGPRFAVSAMREPDFGSKKGVPLQRIQIVKGWLTHDGTPAYEVFEAAGDPDNGATVDLDTCERLGQGFDTLCSLWTDPAFDPDRPGFYYARVVENPTCRWSTHECIRLPPEERPEACSDPALEKTVQERAWTSPIWYQP